MPIQCENRLTIDFDELAKQLLPFFWRDTIKTDAEKIIWLSYYCSFFSALNYSGDDLLRFCEEIRTRLGYTGQHLALEELLNDNYDPDERRIYIEELNNPYSEGTSLPLNNEPNPHSKILIPLNNEPQDADFFLPTNDEINDPDNIYFISFIIWIPLAITITEELVNALVAIYAIAPKRWIIKRF